MLGLPCSQVRGYAAGFGRSSGPQDHKKSYQQKNKNSGQHYKPKPQVSDAYRRSRDGVKSPLLEREHANLHENPAATDPDEHVLRSPLHDILTPTTSVDPDDAIEIEDDHRTSIKKQKHHKQSLSALRINHAIPGYSSILLVRQDQAPEVMLAKDAVKIAEEEGLDLVEVSSKGPQPVCKLLDYAKHAIDMQRREIEHAKAVKKQQKVMEMKEMRMTPLTDTNDFNMKIKRVIEWLGQGRQVRVFIMFRKGQRKLVDEAFITLEAARERIKEAGSILSCTAREDQARLDEERERMGLPPKLLTLALVAAPKKQAPKDDASTPSANAPSP